jgi:hypothetical protein
MGRRKPLKKTILASASALLLLTLNMACDPEETTSDPERIIDLVPASQQAGEQASQHLVPFG